MFHEMYREPLTQQERFMDTCIRKTKSDSPLRQSQYCYTRAEVAEELGVSVQRVAQIERRALNKLRRMLSARGFLKQDAMDLF